jgi:hypothetical protein
MLLMGASNFWLPQSLHNWRRKMSYTCYELGWNSSVVHSIPNLVSIFLSLGRLSKGSVQVLGPVKHFVTNLFFHGEELLVPRQTPKLEDHPLSAGRDHNKVYYSIKLS